MGPPQGPQGRELHGHSTFETFLKVLDGSMQFMDDVPLTFRGGSSKSCPTPIADVGASVEQGAEGCKIMSVLGDSITSM